jgi:hypothetical protein
VKNKQVIVASFPDGPDLGLPTRWAKIRCHSLIIATLSPAMKEVLLSHSPETPTCNCSCICDSMAQELYSIVLPHVPAVEVVRMLNQGPRLRNFFVVIDCHY